MSHEETNAETHARGMTVRREVLGDDHVDRAVAGTSAFTADFQDLITRYAWGEIWSRPGLDRRTRSCITLTALVALGREDELEMHVRAALGNGLTPDEIGELLLQCAVYCGVPAANGAFAIAQRVIDAGEGERDPRRHPLGRSDAGRPLRRRRCRGSVPTTSRLWPSLRRWSARASIRRRSKTSGSAAPIRPARTTATWPGSRRFLRAFPRASPASPSTGSARRD